MTKNKILYEKTPIACLVLLDVGGMDTWERT